VSPLLTKRLQVIFSKITEISPQELLEKMQALAPYFLIDVREDSEWMKGTLPEAIHITRGKLELNIEKLTQDPEAEIILFCGGGTRSALAADNLQMMGYQNIKSLNGGFRAWQEAGFPIQGGKGSNLDR
jgi:rhodanese-related sulfurtransferase